MKDNNYLSGPFLVAEPASHSGIKITKEYQQQIETGLLDE